MSAASKLAMFGGEMSVKGQIARYNSIGAQEAAYVEQCVLGYPLSGYLGGRLRGGHWVQRLEEMWAEKFGVRHAIAVNSATSGLLAAARAIEIGAEDSFITTPFTMSATAAAPSFFGAKPIFIDVTDDGFSMDVANVEHELENGAARHRAIIVTNLFGCPARLKTLRELADRYGCKLIEDNAQAILAQEDGRYAGTIGHIGVFSLNVHKHIQCGEGGVVVTDDDEIADDIRKLINHGEMFGGPRGLNLRMPEVCAAVAVAQFDRVEEIVQERIDQAMNIKIAIFTETWVHGPAQRLNTKNVYYMLPMLYEPHRWPIPDKGSHRDFVVDALMAEGVPLVKGYVEPINQLWTFRKEASEMPKASELHNHTLFQFSNCEWSPTREQIVQFGDAFKKVGDALRDGSLYERTKR